MSIKTVPLLAKDRKPAGFWKGTLVKYLKPIICTDIIRQRSFFEEVGAKLGVQHLDDWYSIPVSKVLKIGGSSVLRQYEFSLRKGTTMCT
jgi:hypothetical protein